MSPRKRNGVSLKSRIANTTAEERQALSLRIADALESLEPTIEDLIYRYGKRLHDTLGMEDDDIRADLTEEVWKACLTYNPTAETKATLKTYATKLLYNRISELKTRSSLPKHNFVAYYGDMVGSGIADLSVDEDTGETLMARRSAFISIASALNSKAEKVYQMLLLGYTLKEMVEKTGFHRSEVISLVNQISQTIAGLRVSDVR